MSMSGIYFYFPDKPEADGGSLFDSQKKKKKQEVAKNKEKK